MMKHTEMMTEETQLVANNSQNSSELSSLLMQRKRRILGAVVLCITFFGAGLKMGTTTPDTIITHGDSGGVSASMMALRLVSSLRAAFATNKVPTTTALTKRPSKQPTVAPTLPDSYFGKDGTLGGSNPTNPDTSIIEDKSGICTLPSPPSRTYNSQTDYCFEVGEAPFRKFRCWTDNSYCLPIYGPWKGIGGVGNNQCGPACGSPESGFDNFAVRTKYCYESHGIYDSQRDFCFGSGAARCWSHQDCKPEGPWGGLSGIGNNNCGDPCTTFENNKIYTPGCCTITEANGHGGLSTTLEIYDRSACIHYTQFPFNGNWNSQCECLTKNGKWTGWNNECGYHD